MHYNACFFGFLCYDNSVNKGDDMNNNESIRQKLLISGIAEIETYGIAGFSYRRVAKNCNVSCATPYRHFKSKDDFILEILKYLNSQWTLLRSNIEGIFTDPIERIIEICIALIRYTIANPDYRSIFLLSPVELDTKILDEIRRSTSDIAKDIETALKDRSTDDDSIRLCQFEIISLIYGAVSQINTKEIANTEESFQMIKMTIERRLREKLVNN